MFDSISLDETTANAPDALPLATFHANITDGVTRGTSHTFVRQGSG
jgi:hypothetical protein